MGAQVVSSPITVSTDFNIHISTGSPSRKSFDGVKVGETAGDGTESVGVPAIVVEIVEGHDGYHFTPHSLGRI